MQYADQLETDNHYADQLGQIYQVIEQLEDAIAASNKHAQLWSKEKKQLIEANAKLDKKLQSANEDVRFIKEHLDQAKKEREQAGLIGKKEQATMQAEIKELREKNKLLSNNMEKVTQKLDAAITKIGALMAE